MNKSARYLVTGGAGFIGSNIVETLIHSGEKVRVLDNFSTGKRENLATFDTSLVEVIEGSVADGLVVEQAMRNIEVVFHEGALPSVPRSVERPLDSDTANVHGTLTILEAARHAGVKRVLFAGSSSAYGNTPTLPKVETTPTVPLSPYAASKVAGELYLKVYASLHGLETLTFRYFNVFGPRQDPNGAYAAVIPRWVSAAMNNTPIVVHGDGGQTRDFCYIQNVVHGNLLAANTSKKLAGEVVNLSCGDRVSLLQLADAIAEELGVSIQKDHVAPRVGDVRDSFADVGRARALLGFEPQVFWREGLKRTIASMRNGLGSSK